MRFLKDEMYENLDWLSQATTPFLSSINDELRDMPEEIVVPESEILTALRTGYGIGVSECLPEETNEYIASHCYEFYSDNPDIIIDANKNMLPHLTLKKTKQSFTEKELIDFVVDKTYRIISPNIKSINDLVEILVDVDKQTKVLKSTSARKKMSYLRLAIRNIIQENKWNIRNADLMFSLIQWIRNYLNNDNLAAYANICKLKLMARKGNPIYSISETV